MRYVAAVTNSYYGLKTLSARKGKHSTAVARATEAPATPAIDVAQHEQPQASKTGLAGRFFMLSRVKEKRSNETH